MKLKFKNNLDFSGDYISRQQDDKWTTVANQSKPLAKEVSMAGAMSLAAVMMYFSARTFLRAETRQHENKSTDNLKD